MNKAELVDRVARRTGFAARDTRLLVDAIFDPDPATGLIAAQLALGRKVVISGFGTFESRPRRARAGRNPHTGETLEIPASRAPTFRAGRPLKDLLRSAERIVRAADAQVRRPSRA